MPETIETIFEKKAVLPSLVGIEVYLIYQPTTAENDATYRVVSEFYKTLLESKGATVNISANLSN